MIIPSLDLYMVQSADGKWLRSLGRNGARRGCWVDDPKDAKIWTKLSQARSRVTFFVNHYPAYLPPVLVKLNISSAEEINERERLQKVKEAKERKTKKRQLARSAENLVQAREKFEQAKKELQSLERGN